MSATKSYQNIIEINPEIRFGKPVIKGTRISVYEILGWLADGQTNEDILSDFPQLTIEHIQACLLFASDKNRMITVV